MGRRTSIAPEVRRLSVMLRKTLTKLEKIEEVLAARKRIAQRQSDMERYARFVERITKSAKAAGARITIPSFTEWRRGY